MKAVRLLMRCMIVLWAASPLLVRAQENVYDLKAGYYHFDKILPSQLDQRMPHKGKFVDGLGWKDEAGQHALFLCYDAKPQENSRDIYLYQYCEVGGSVQLVWDIQDFGGALCEMTFVDNSLQIIDLDQDGIMEACFMYQNRCDGLDPYVTKMMLMKGGQKLAIRGKFSVEDHAELEKTIDPVVAQQPAIFKNFMLMNWNEFKNSEFEYSKSILYKTASFIVLKREYLLASGGTEFQVLDLNGLPLPLAKGMQEKIGQAVSLDLMPDRKQLLYASLQGVGTYNPETKVETAFMTFLEDTEAISTVTWSPDKTKIAFTALNPQQYPQSTRIFVLTLGPEGMVKKEKYDAKLMYMAASNWVVESPRFKDNNVLEYREMLVEEGDIKEGPVKRIFLE
jgi:hypothetical protein